MKTSLIIRHLKLYYRDKTAVFFSLLSSLIVIGVYALFLAQGQIDVISKEVTQNISLNDITYFVHTMLLAGLLAMTSLTSVLGGYGVLIHDWQQNIMKDFKSAPIPSWKYPLSICMASFIIGVITSLLTLVIYDLVILMDCGYGLSISIVWKCFLMIILSSLFSTTCMGAICVSIKTSGAYSSISTVIGTFIGFVNGMYVPLGTLNRGIVNVIVSFPFIHIASLLRKILTEESFIIVFKDVPQHIQESFMNFFGMTLKIFNYQIHTELSILYIVSMIIISTIVMIQLWRKKN